MKGATVSLFNARQQTTTVAAIVKVGIFVVAQYIYFSLLYMEYQMNVDQYHNTDLINNKIQYEIDLLILFKMVLM